MPNSNNLCNISESELLEKTNGLLEQVQIDYRVQYLGDITPSLFVIIYERLLGHQLKDVIREPCGVEEEIHNCQTVIDSLSMDVLDVPLSHITGDDIVALNYRSLDNLLEVFSGLAIYILGAIDSEPDSEVEEWSGRKSLERIVNGSNDVTASQAHESRNKKDRPYQALPAWQPVEDNDAIQFYINDSRDPKQKALSEIGVIQAQGSNTSQHSVPVASTHKRYDERMRKNSPSKDSSHFAYFGTRRNNGGGQGDSAPLLDVPLCEPIAAPVAVPSLDLASGKPGSSQASSIVQSVSQQQLASFPLNPSSNARTHFTQSYPCTANENVHSNSPREIPTSTAFFTKTGLNTCSPDLRDTIHSLESHASRVRSLSSSPPKLPQSQKRANLFDKLHQNHIADGVLDELSVDCFSDKRIVQLRDTNINHKTMSENPRGESGPGTSMLRPNNTPTRQSKQSGASNNVLKIEETGSGCSSVKSGPMINNSFEEDRLNSAYVTSRGKASQYQTSKQMNKHISSLKTGSGHNIEIDDVRVPQLAYNNNMPINSNTQNMAANRHLNITQSSLLCNPATDKLADTIHTIEEQLDRLLHPSKHVNPSSLKPASDPEADPYEMYQRTNAPVAVPVATVPKTKGKGNRKKKQVKFRASAHHGQTIIPGKSEGAARQKLQKCIKTLGEVYDQDLQQTKNDLYSDLDIDRQSAHSIDKKFKNTFLGRSKKRYTSPSKTRSTPSLVRSKERKRSASVSQSIGQQKSIAGDDDLVSSLLEEFPYLYISGEAWHELWRKGIQQIEQATKRNDEAKRSKSRSISLIEEADRRQDVLHKLIKKQLAHSQRLRDTKLKKQNDIALRNHVRDKRIQMARARRYYDQYQVQMRAKMLKKRTREEQVFKQLFKDTLDLHKQKAAELYSQDKKQKEQRNQRERNELASIENFYQDQFELLAAAVAQERQDLLLRESAQQKVLQQMKRTLRHKMENEISDIQEELFRDNDNTYFRKLDAERVYNNLKSKSAPVV